MMTRVWRHPHQMMVSTTLAAEIDSKILPDDEMLNVLKILWTGKYLFKKKKKEEEEKKSQGESLKMNLEKFFLWLLWIKT